MTRVLLVGERRVPWAAPGWSRGLRELGVDVVDWDWTPRYSPGLMGRIERRLLVGPGIVRINRGLVKAVQNHAPDIVLLYAAWPIAPGTIRTISRDFWVAGYHNDNPFGGFGHKAYFRFWRRALPFFHSHHVFRPQNVADYRRAGVRRVKVLLPFYLPWLDRPQSSSIGEQKVEHDIVFVGHAEKDHRIACVEALLAAGLPLKIYGYGDYWRRYVSDRAWKALKPIRLVEGVEYRKVIAGAKICLAFFSRANRDECTFRVFEIPAAGGFLLAERTRTMQELYHEGQEVALFSSPDELVEKCKYYLSHNVERARLARCGHVRCVTSGYDVVSRMRQWLADTQSWMAGASE